MTIVRASAEGEPAEVELAKLENELVRNRFYSNIVLLALGVTLAPLVLLLWLALANSDCSRSFSPTDNCASATEVCSIRY
jgi:hypothetical protein